MTLDEAKQVLRDSTEVRVGRLGFAAMVLCRPENASEVSFEDLIQCLRRGNSFGKCTLMDELAALILYSRTGRIRKQGHAAYEDFITNADDWLVFLKNNGFVKG